MKIIKLLCVSFVLSSAVSLSLLGCDGDNGAGGGGSYESVSIEGTKWMKKNLNIETADSWCYNNSADSCAIYGSFLILTSKTL
jgi:thiamine pyrophosphokinase